MRAITQFECHKFSLGLWVLALLCLPAVALPQTPMAGLADPPFVGPKKASQLIVGRTIPEYPPLAKINYIQGRVQLELRVAADGKVVRAHVLKGHPILAASALQAIRKWIYRPLRTPSGPSGFLTTVELNYTLRYQALELRPAQAERDLSRQIVPPEVLQRPAETSFLKRLMHIRLLLNDQGQVIDSEPSLEGLSDFAAAQNTLQDWSFRPARWGTLPIPWYLDIDVPINGANLAAPAGGPEKR